MTPRPESAEWFTVTGPLLLGRPLDRRYDLLRSETERDARAERLFGWDRLRPQASEGVVSPRSP
jgi:hypothetical protein